MPVHPAVAPSRPALTLYEIIGQPLYYEPVPQPSHLEGGNFS